MELNNLASRFWLGYVYCQKKEEYIELLQWVELVCHEYLNMTFNEDTLKMKVEDKEVLKKWAFYEMTPFLAMLNEIYSACPEAVYDSVNKSKYINFAYKNCTDPARKDYLQSKSTQFLYRKGRDGNLEKIVM